MSYEEEEAQISQEETEGQSEEKAETENIVDKATAAAKRLETATAAQKVENDRQEALQARQALGGQSEAGQIKEKPKVETDKEYADRVMAGDVKMNDGK